jgi:hypothetical protein
MSTRCQIQIEGNKALLYVHSDGYPSGILPLLLPFVERFQKARGDDPEFLAGRLIQHLANESDKHMAEWEARMKAEGQKGVGSYGERFTGFGVDTDIHGDIEYLYVVKEGGTVEVRRARGGQTLGKFKVGTSPDAAVKVCEGEDK